MIFKKDKKIQEQRKQIIGLNNKIVKLENELKMLKNVPEGKEKYEAINAGGAVLYIPSSQKERIDKEWREREGRGDN